MKSTFARRLPALLLVLALLLGALSLSACGNAEETSAGTDETEAASEADTTADRLHTPDNLPEGLRFDGKTIRIITRVGDDDTRLEFVAEKDNTELVEAAVYERNAIVENRLGMKMEIIGMDQNRHNGDVVNGKITASIHAGSDDYDLIGNHMSQTTPNILSGYFLNLVPVEYIDWDMPWWSQSFVEETSLAGKIYTTVGDLSLSYIAGFYVMFFNQKLWGQYFPDEQSLYEIIRQRKCTVGKLQECITDFNQDLDGDGKIGREDLIGLYYERSSIMSDAMAGACNIVYAAYDPEAEAYAYVLNCEHSLNFVAAVKSLLFESNGAWLDDYTFVNGLESLAANRTLFTINMLSGTNYLRTMEDDYGIIPLPMLDEAQGDYSGFAHSGCTVFSIPATVTDTDFVGAFLEAMSAESYRRVTPAYFDVALKYKYARDPDAAEMLDLIAESARFDFCLAYSQCVDTLPTLFRGMFSSAAECDKAASTFRSRQKSTEKLIKQLMEKSRKLTK